MEPITFDIDSDFSVTISEDRTRLQHVSPYKLTWHPSVPGRLFANQADVLRAIYDDLRRAGDA